MCTIPSTNRFKRTCSLLLGRPSRQLYKHLRSRKGPPCPWSPRTPSTSSVVSLVVSANGMAAWRKYLGRSCADPSVSQTTEKSLLPRLRSPRLPRPRRPRQLPPRAPSPAAPPSPLLPLRPGVEGTPAVVLRGMSTGRASPVTRARPRRRV